MEEGMQGSRRAPLLAGLLASTALVIAPAMAADYHFDQVAMIHLPGNTGHGDIVTFDPSNNMLYVSMPKQGLSVVNTKTNEVAAYIEDVPSPNGVDWDADHVYVAAADGPPAPASAGSLVDNAIIVISKKTWTEVGRVKTRGTSPDWLAVDRQAGLLYTDSDDKNWMEVYTTGDQPQFKAKWRLHPLNSNFWLIDTADFTGPDVAALVPSRHEIFQSVDSYVEVIDTATGAIVRNVDTGVELTPKGGTKGEVYDAKNNRLWVATTGKQIFILNPDTLATIATLPQKSGADMAVFDPGLGLIYVFEGGGKGFDVYDANAMTHVTFVSTGIGQTHTGDVDPATHLVYAYGGNDRVIVVFKPVK
jgi:hypothetical protein